MKRSFVLAVALIMSAASANPVSAARGAGGGPRGGGGGGAGARSAPAVSRPAKPPANAGGGFNLNHDVSAPRPPASQRPNNPGSVANRPGGSGNTIQRPGGSGSTIQRPAGSGNTVQRPNGGANGTQPPRVNGNGNTINRPHNTVNANTTNVNVNRYGNRPIVVNPVYRGPAWGWNHGVVWSPAPSYWGGGFWGALAIGAASAAVYGSIVNSQTHQTVTSYQVQPSSPGATLLSNYHLTQVQCGPPNLVQIFGPDNSVICAQPNGTVAAGDYDLDTAQLSLVSRQ